MITATPAPRKVFIKTYGCQMNVYDSERMADALAPHGYAATDALAEADLVLLNTCHIREKAAEKVFSELGRLKELRLEREATGHRLTIGVAGCVAQAEGEEISRRAPAVDLVFGPQSYHRLPELLARVERGERVVDTEFPPESKFAHLPAPAPEVTLRRGLSAFLTVQEGCDKFCSFCVVPYTRGAEASRPVGEILAEARALAAAGVREITLLGQNVNAFAGPDGAGGTMGLAGLLHRLAEIPGVARLRYTTSHPRDMDEALIAAHRDLPALMPYLHLPVQSGSDKVLKAMNRRHTAADYLGLLERIRAARPDIALSGDFIVGFPGETDRDFEATLALIRAVGYASAFSFKYSARPGTPGASLPEQVPETVKTERLHRLQELVNAGQRRFAEGLVGRTLPVLLDRPGRLPNQLGGRSPYLLAVHCPGPVDLIGTIQQVAIVGVGNNSLEGRIVTEPSVKSASFQERERVLAPS